MTLEKPAADAAAAPPRAAKTSTKVKTQFPPARWNFVQDRNGGSNAWKFMEYWQNLPEEMTPFAQVRIYRCWPVVNEYLGGEETENKVFEFIDGACPFKDPHGYVEYFIKRFSGGDWKLILQEIGVPGKVMSCMFPARSLENPSVEDFENYAPQIDIRTLTRHKNNDSYIRWRRRTNQSLPWEDTEEDLFMGTAPAAQQQHQQSSPAAPLSAASALGEAFKSMAESHVLIARTAVEGAEKRADATIKASEMRAQGPDPMATAHNESIRLITATADKMVNMVTQHAGAQYDPIAILKAAKELNGPPKETDGGGMMGMVLKTIEASNDRVFALYERQAATTERMIGLKNNGDGSHGPATEKRKSFLEEAQEYKQMGALFGWEQSRALARTEPPPPEKPSWFNEQTAPVIIMGVQTIFVLTANIIFNWAATKIKGMEPQAPGAAVNEAMAHVAHMNGDEAPPAQQQQRPQQAQQPSSQEQLRQFAIDFEAPFIGHFYVDNPRGYTLAHYLMSEASMQDFTVAGTRNYRNLKTLGRTTIERVAQFKKLLAGNVNLWSKIQGNIPALDRFLTEFYTFEEFLQEETERRRKVQAEMTNAGAAAANGAAE